MGAPEPPKLLLLMHDRLMLSESPTHANLGPWKYSLRRLLFADMRSQHSGGAIYIHDEAVVSLMECSFEHNQAQEYGGAIYVDPPATLVVAGCTFIANGAYRAGGAIYLYGGGTITISLTTFRDNTAHQDHRVDAMLVCQSGYHWYTNAEANAAFNGEIAEPNRLPGRVIQG
eukprot:SAG11_NODE_9669_length_890_cov_7.230088_1_plen_172_part_00